MLQIYYYYMKHNYIILCIITIKTKILKVSLLTTAG